MLSRVVLLGLATATCVQLPARPSAPQTQAVVSLTSRRSMLASAASFALLQQLPGAAQAEVRGANSALMGAGEKEVNKFLTNNGFAAMKVPNGLSPLALYIGLAAPANIDGSKTKERYFKSTLLVRFLYPSGWLVETPSITENGEAGKIAANNYLKGDSADFVSLPKPKGKKLEDLDKEFFKTLIGSQMTNDVYEDVKVKKIKAVTQPDGAETIQFDFTYTLLTRAGFTVNRKGVGAIMDVGDAVTGLIIATTDQRFKVLEEDVRKCTDAFRAYPVKTPDLFLGAQ